MNIGHDPVVVSHSCYAGILARTDIEGAKFPDLVAVSDLEPGRFSGIFLVLRYFSERDELVDPVVLSDFRMSADHGMRADPGARIDFDMLSDDRIRADLDIARNIGAG